MGILIIPLELNGWTLQSLVVDTEWKIRHVKEHNKRDDRSHGVSLILVDPDLFYDRDFVSFISNNMNKKNAN